MSSRIVSSYSEGFSLGEVEDDEAEAMDMLATGSDKTWMMIAPGEGGTYEWDDEVSDRIGGVVGNGLACG